jgi:iron(III) transport system permease protein
MTYQDVISGQFLQLIWNSLLVSGLGALAIVVVAVILANSGRLNDTLVSRIYAKITLFGYSIPGAVIAIGVITLFIAIDRSLGPFYEWLGISKQLVISTSLFLLLFAYTIRFLAVGFNSIESGFTKIGNTYTEASRTLGMSVTETFFKVDLRMVKGAIAGGFILSFVDILKELPLTLILQPFNFYTLATKAFQYASDERIQEAALASILIILISAVCIYILQRLLERELR